MWSGSSPKLMQRHGHKKSNFFPILYSNRCFCMFHISKTNKQVLMDKLMSSNNMSLSCLAKNILMDLIRGFPGRTRGTKPSKQWGGWCDPECCRFQFSHGLHFNSTPVVPTCLRLCLCSTLCSLTSFSS